MAPPKNSRPVLLMLVLFSCGIIVFTWILIGCSFAINYSTDLRPDESDDDPAKGNEWGIQVGFNYDQYWAGIPFLATGLLVLLSGIYQRSRTRAIIAAMLCIVAIGLSLLVLSLDGRRLSVYMFRERMKIYWESKNHTCKTSCRIGFSEWENCRNENSTIKHCVCFKNGNPRNSYTQHGCEQNSKLTGLYASVIVSSIIVTLCCLSSLIVIAMTLLRKRTEHNHIGHNADHVGTSSNAPLLAIERVERVARHEPISTTIM